MLEHLRGHLRSVHNIYDVKKDQLVLYENYPGGRFDMQRVRDDARGYRYDDERREREVEMEQERPGPSRVTVGPTRTPAQDRLRSVGSQQMMPRPTSEEFKLLEQSIEAKLEAKFVARKLSQTVSEGKIAKRNLQS